MLVILRPVQLGEQHGYLARRWVIHLSPPPPISSRRHGGNHDSALRVYGKGEVTVCQTVSPCVRTSTPGGDRLSLRDGAWPG